MKLNRATSVWMLVMALGITVVSAEAGQRDSRGRDRNRRSQAQSRQSGGNGGAPRAVERPQIRPVQPRQPAAVARPQSREFETRAPQRQATPSRVQAVPRYDRRSDDRRGYDNGPRDVYRDNRNNSYRTRDIYSYRAPAPRYYSAPRVVVPVPVYPRHYYGPRGNFSVYFGWGNGYRYGAPWSGRVYGYAPPVSYGTRVYYGDVRLQVRPRNAAVYVDGYYAGVVDDFDGTFQRLTIQAGPHQIELDAPGLQPQFFDIYVDPARTVTLHADLY
jgi:hypothetical protein